MATPLTFWAAALVAGKIRRAITIVTRLATELFVAAGSKRLL